VVDRELVLRKCAALDGYLAELSQLRSIDLETYRSDWKTQRVVERSLHLAIEVSLDLADHLIADRGLRAPTTQAETFEILHEAGILEPTLTQSLMQMARFRNLLVHDYARIDPEKVLKILQERLGDLDKFKRAVLLQVENLDERSPR
jgi:uncharacterized protein YutE (UPF0331/DUF86 family)